MIKNIAYIFYKEDNDWNPKYREDTQKETGIINIKKEEDLENNFDIIINYFLDPFFFNTDLFYNRYETYRLFFEIFKDQNLMKLFITWDNKIFQFLNKNCEYNILKRDLDKNKKWDIIINSHIIKIIDIIKK